jgi:SagB-type dehydrogenase family enzyme
MASGRLNSTPYSSLNAACTPAIERLLLLLTVTGLFSLATIPRAMANQSVLLPTPDSSAGHSLERVLAERRSLREFAPTPLGLSELGQLLWAAQGITNPRGFRTAPSAGALYPLEIFVIAGAVDGLTQSVYRYEPRSHRLEPIADGDHRKALGQAALGQNWLADAPVTLVIAAVYARSTCKYGERGVRYTHMEVGHAAQNLFLQAAALGLGTVVVGAFREDRVSQLLGLPRDVRPLALMPVGHSPEP